MSGEISIRPAVVEDAADVLAIERSCAEAPHWSEAVWAQILVHRSQYAQFGPQPFGPLPMCLVAEQAEAVVGFAVIRVMGASVPDSGVAELESLAVRQDARRRGVGRSLCLQAMFWAQTMGAVSMQLEVRSASVAALALYRSLGFVEQGRRSGYYTDPKDDAVMMELPLIPKDA
jgi:ribosomal-protein-alanine N-acetyltransferase